MGDQRKTFKFKVFAVTLSVMASLFLIRVMAGETKRTLFPHKSHVELHACPDCHKDPKGSTEPVIPDGAVCKECHDDSPEDLLDLENRKKPSPILAFTHKSHAKQVCTECHVIKENQLPEIPGYPACSACHSKKNVAAGCKDCHNTPFTPDYHTGLWTKTHGFRAETENGGRVHGRDCDLCHSQPSCTRCHQTRKPRSHTGFFIKRGHGLNAAIESESCRTCHKESFCVRCHRETKPMNHRGNWEYIHGFAIPGGRDGSIGKCAVCHKASWCAACHNGK